VENARPGRVPSTVSPEASSGPRSPDPHGQGEHFAGTPLVVPGCDDVIPAPHTATHGRVARHASFAGMRFALDWLRRAFANSIARSGVCVHVTTVGHAMKIIVLVVLACVQNTAVSGGRAPGTFLSPSTPYPP
jgi:hypothetical protein